MREFIRHPLDIPLEFQLGDTVAHETDYIKDISGGGLCFRAKHLIEPGNKINICIPLSDPEFFASGVVSWCNSVADHYEVGVKFMDVKTEFSVRMMEQVCHIEQYKNDLFVNEGRRLSDEEAAVEWVSKFAKDFPQ